jgi:hypothetical protein
MMGTGYLVMDVHLYAEFSMDILVRQALIIKIPAHPSSLPRYNQ